MSRVQRARRPQRLHSPFPAKQHRTLTFFPIIFHHTSFSHLPTLSLYPFVHHTKHPFRHRAIVRLAFSKAIRSVMYLHSPRLHQPYVCTSTHLTAVPAVMRPKLLTLTIDQKIVLLLPLTPVIIGAALAADYQNL
jgi:hypothetical protein